jgi:hypothetical protein
LQDAISGRPLDTLDRHFDEVSPNWAKGFGDQPSAAVYRLLIIDY